MQTSRAMKTRSERRKQ